MAESYMEPWNVNKAIQIPGTTQPYSGNGSMASVNPGDYMNMNSAFDYGMDGNYGFDEYGNPISLTPTLDKFKMGVGGVNSIMGVLGTLDAMKTNKKNRAAIDQNMKHAAMARTDRTDFLNGTKSAFA
jgi:hypothetical protein